MLDDSVGTVMHSGSEGPLAQSGFALPSMIMLVLLLTSVALAVLSLSYLERKRAITEVLRLKAECAAESGVVALLAEQGRNANDRYEESEDSVSFADGTIIRTHRFPWGVLLGVESRGIAGRAQVIRHAVLGLSPGSEYDYALVVGDLSHQLILTGSAAIRGNVLVGPPGAGTGALHGYSTPAVLPLKGSVEITQASRLPRASDSLLAALHAYYSSILEGRRVPRWALVAEPQKKGTVALPDTDLVVRLLSGSQLPAVLDRPHARLYFCTPGSVTIGADARLHGLIAVIARDSIVVESGADVAGLLLVSFRSIRLRSSALRSIQCLAPRIIVEKGASCAYPSILVSTPWDTAGAHQGIYVNSGAQVQGFLGLVSPWGEDGIVLDSGSVVRGAACSSGRVTIDGRVVGSVLAQNLFFYEPPAIHIGWMRQGTIDRPARPRGFLVPPIYLSERRLEVMDWR